MSEFAKLFEFEDLGQVLVKLDDGDDGAEVRIYFVPKGLGVCSVAMTFKADGQADQLGKAEKAFTLVDREKAHALVTDTLRTIPSGLSAT
ncbi:hypothetical protein ACIOVF_19135 [Pseudomonas sp. NPDC087612]|uniref:hypothetical protein n=1 Tax=Pseudomonas sp. NPDC087612 TaxID=3364441 RepID=UPI0037F15844